jgi:16S rRNA (guanine527-N7)-methyltransferase
MPDLFQVHRRLLERWRRVANLVGPGPVEEHYADCAGALAGLAPTGSWADLGSGAGFPGIPFAAAFPGIRVDLVESRARRCAFLEQVLLEAGVGERIRVVRARIEDLEGESYDGVLSRALAPWPEVLGHAARLLRAGGEALLLHAVDEAPDGAGFELIARRIYEVGGKRRAVSRLRRVR